MRRVPELGLGFRDAENYKRKENKELFERIFLRTPELGRLCEPSSFFLIGEKGTGKTAYAVFLANAEYKNNVATLRYIRETDYQKFVSLKRTKNLTLSDYVSIWKVIIYLLLAEQIREKERRNPLFKGFLKFDKLSGVIDQYYQHAFSPEIQHAIQFAEEAAVTAGLIAAGLGASDKISISSSESKFQINLLYIENHFEDALRSLKLAQSHILFIDGIDIRPQSVGYDTYLECIKGLGNAVWSVNNDFFAGIKGSKGRMRVVLLVRPDIFNALGLQNQNSKVRDNSVILNWTTTYPEYRRSPIFLMADQLLAYQQDVGNPAPGSVWDYYFPYDAKNVRTAVQSPSSFITFLRYSLYRPRDILTMLSIQKENFIEEGRDASGVFRYEDFTTPAFTRKYSDYLLGEVRDHISFYYDLNDYEKVLKFFQFLDGRSRFSYTQYLKAFTRYVGFMKRNSMPIPTFCDTPDNFLQFLYDLNIICSKVDSTNSGSRFFGWCYRERSPSNIAPKVRLGVDYEVHYGLMKALDLGKHFLVDESTLDCER
ncbi:MAG: funZ protein [Chloroflexi bacterium]|nr:funZ protein [Chloroflexota bacterium]